MTFQEVSLVLRLTPAVGLPLPSMPVTMRTPPTARTLNWLALVDGKLKLLESAHTKAPA